MTEAGSSPNLSVSGRTKSCATNTATLAPISAFIALDSGPGPNENEDVYGEELRRMKKTPKTYYIPTKPRRIIPDSQVQQLSYLYKIAEFVDPQRFHENGQ